MKIIDTAVLKKAMNELGINLGDIEYYTSGKCSDLYLYNGDLLKILKWYDKSDNIDAIDEKFDFKIDFINYLSQNINCVQLKKINDNYYKIIKYAGEYYVIYRMKCYDKFDQKIDAEQIGDYLKKFHNISRKYKENSKYIKIDWEKEFDSIYSIPNDEKLKNQFKKYYEKIKLLKKNKKNYGIIHYDSNIYNYISINKKIYLIDFDTICYGWYLMDISNYLFSLYNIDMSNGLFMNLSELNKKALIVLNKYGFDKSCSNNLNLFFNYRFMSIYLIVNKYIKNDEIRNNIEKKLLGEGVKII